MFKHDGGREYVMATLCPFETAFLQKAVEIVQLDDLPAEERVMLLCNLRDIARKAESEWQQECHSWARFVRSNADE